MLCQGGQSPFRVEAISVSLAEPMALPVREMNRIRREFYERLERFHDAEVEERNRSRQDAIFKEYEAINEGSWKGAQPGPEVIPYEELGGKGSSQGPSESLWVELPLFVSEAALEAFLEELQGRLRDGRLGFVAHSLGWVDYLNQRVAKDRIASGGYLYCSNRFAYKFLREQGAAWVFLSADSREGEIRNLFSYRNTARARESGLRFFITRLALPAGNLSLQGSGPSGHPAQGILRGRPGFPEVIKGAICEHRTSLPPCTSPQSPAPQDVKQNPEHTPRSCRWASRPRSCP